MKGLRATLGLSSLLAFSLACRRVQNQASITTPTAEPYATASLVSVPPSSGPPYPVGGEVSAPVLVYQAKPAIPERYRHAHITQPLYIYDVVVSETGRVTSVRLFRGDTDGEPYVSFERAFREAIAKNEYSPAMRAGTPVAVTFTITATIEVQ